MGVADGYAATMKLAEERPDLLPLLQLIQYMGTERFNDGLAELVERGILERGVIHDAPIP